MRISRLALIASVMIGVAAGVGGFTFVYAHGASYLGHDPAACANCHIMSEHYSAWIKSSHRSVAGCNDCHTPNGFIPKYLTKASNGFWHSFAFTTGRFPDPIRIKPGNHAITEGACRKCHTEITETIDHYAGVSAPAEFAAQAPRGDGSRVPEPLVCTRCHRYVGHFVR